ncbi:trp operon repressor [Vibrio rumoiensis]|uniref:Trp operon repressor homolog n=1 Tax=Vibrio rumoiensis 1S-45 TaxID=1188252 RepID=A0A1E5DY69_9VIBR|nr:trp operon repressor [Vibrio rumoiensis]OEF22566.1 Trp operon repressor [Vibrio rumoiensis 1S-45]
MTNATEPKGTPEFERWQDVLSLLEQSCQQEQLDFLLSMLLTFDEREALLARMNILHELMKGEHSQRQISQMLGVGVATITRGSTELKKLEQDKKQQLQRMLQAAVDKE